MDNLDQSERDSVRQLVNSGQKQLPSLILTVKAYCVSCSRQTTFKAMCFGSVGGQSLHCKRCHKKGIQICSMYFNASEFE
jgi:hypothetical protein